MKYFKVLFFVLVLAPISVFATIVGDSNNSENGKVASYGVNLDEAFHTLIVGENEAYITRGFLNTSFSDLTITREENFNESSIVAMELDVGILTVPAGTMALDVFTQPSPAPKWSIGTAMLGLLTVSRRK